MIQALVTDIAQKLLTANSEWLFSIKTIGQRQRKAVLEGRDSFFLMDEEFNDIGLTDIRQNSGYIRQRSETAMTITDAPRISSVNGSTYNVPLTLVLAVKAPTTTDLLFLLSRQLRSITYTTFLDLTNVKCQPVSAGNNSKANALNEMGKDPMNNDYKIIYVDFNLIFTDYKDCDLTDNIETPMDCECTNVFKLGCASTCDTITIEVESTTESVIVETQMNGSIHSFNVEQVIGENISIPLEIFNENYTHILKIYAGNERVTYSPDPSGIIYDCFSIEIKP